jgi:shikimate dehydrogenase
MRKFGLIGKSLSHSFSLSYFENKFSTNKLIDCSYQNFELQNVHNIRSFVFDNQLQGLNVTIPFKEEIITHLDNLSEQALKIGAVNCISVKGNKLTGHNTDCYGFSNSISPLLQKHHKKALILGTGGASKAVAFSLKHLGIAFEFVSRNGTINYQNVNEFLQNEYSIIINTTPLGTFPNIEKFPDLPYHLLNQHFLLYDLVYNPEISAFLQFGKNKNCVIKNGFEMLELQAEKSWQVWNK